MAWWQWIVLVLLIGAVGFFIYLKKHPPGAGGGKPTGKGGIIR